MARAGASYVDLGQLLTVVRDGVRSRRVQRTRSRLLRPKKEDMISIIHRGYVFGVNCLRS